MIGWLAMLGQMRFVILGSVGAALSTSIFLSLKKVIFKMARRSTGSSSSSSRNSSKNSYGRSNCTNAVWSKASHVRGLDPNLYRRDAYRNVMYRHSYGKTSAMGWQVDHQKPKSLGGSDHLRNLQALNSSVNMSKGNSTVKRTRN